MPYPDSVDVMDDELSKLLNDPSMAPPNTSWDPDKQRWVPKKPGSEGYDKTYGGYTTGDPYGTSGGDKWLKSVYEAQGWDLPPKPGETAAEGAGPSTPTVPGQAVVPTPDRSTPAPRANADEAVRHATNPNLDRLLEEMIAGQRGAEARAQSEAADKAAWRNRIRGNIMSQYDEAAKPVDPNDPMIRSMVRTRNAGNQRALGQGREALAARGSAEGIGTGAFDSAIQQSYENLGRADADFESGLMYDETNKRRNLVQNLLSMGSGVLNADEDRLLRDKFGTLGADLDRLGLKTGAFTSGRGLDLRELEGDRGFGLDQQRITNQNNQFYDDFGFRAASQEDLINRMLMQELLGGA